MENRQMHPGSITSSAGKSLNLEVHLRELPKEERRRIALKSLGLFWGLMLVTLPLPPIHWVTVPFFFFFGIYWSLKRLRENRHLEAFRFTCPECQKEVPCPEQSVKNPLAVTCPHCHYNLKLEWE